jgi:hypothetical protein
MDRQRDEVAWSTAKTPRPNEFTDAQRKPVLLLVGPGALAPVLAPLPPLFVGGVVMLFPRLQAVALGMVAAALGVFVFLVTGLLLVAVF